MAKDIQQEESPDNTQTISDIIRGMQHAVNTAQEVLQDHQFRLMEKYFDAKTGQPLMRYIVLQDGRRVDIPLITLIPSNLLSISELEMDFSVKIASTVVKTFEEKIPTETGNVISEERKRASFGVFFSGLRRKNNKDATDNNAEPESDTDVIHIKMKFKSIEEPEAAARLREMLYNQIV